MHKPWFITLLLIGSFNEVLATPVVTSAAVPSNLHFYNTAGNTYVDLLPHGCSGSRYFLDPAHVKYDTIVSILIAAQLANKKVVLRYDGCNSIPQGRIIGVYLQNE